MVIALIEGLLGGVGITLSLSLSNRLRSDVGNPLAAAMSSFVGGVLLLGLLGGMGIIRWPELSQLPLHPWWMYLGGLAGGLSVALALMAIARLGLAVGVLVSVMGQLIMSLTIDTVGLFGVMGRPIAISKILGIILLLAAVLLAQRPNSSPRTRYE